MRKKPKKTTSMKDYNSRMDDAMNRQVERSTGIDVMKKKKKKKGY